MLGGTDGESADAQAEAGGRDLADHGADIDDVEIRLRGERFQGQLPPSATGGVPVKPALFVLPGGPTIPVIAILSSLLILVGANQTQLISGTIALLVGAVLYLIATRGASAARETR